jgi:hypothetical protein
MGTKRHYLKIDASTAKPIITNLMVLYVTKLNRKYATGNKIIFSIPDRPVNFERYIQHVYKHKDSEKKQWYCTLLLSAFPPKRLQLCEVATSKP